MQQGPDFDNRRATYYQAQSAENPKRFSLEGNLPFPSSRVFFSLKPWQSALVRRVEGLLPYRVY